MDAQNPFQLKSLLPRLKTFRGHAPVSYPCETLARMRPVITELVSNFLAATQHDIVYYLRVAPNSLPQALKIRAPLY